MKLISFLIVFIIVVIVSNINAKQIELNNSNNNNNITKNDLRANRTNNHHNKNHNHRHLHLRHNHRHHRNSTAQVSSMTITTTTNMPNLSAKLNHKIDQKINMNKTQSLRLTMIHSNNEWHRNNRGYNSFDRTLTPLIPTIKVTTIKRDRENDLDNDDDVETIDIDRTGYDGIETFDEWSTRKNIDTTTNRYFKSTTQKNYPEKRICAHQKTIYVPYRTTEVYQKPIYKHYTEECNGQVCTGVRLVHEPVYKNVVKHRQTKQIIYACCHGWEKADENDKGCNRAICSHECKNGGVCTKPDTCKCPSGRTGKFCEKDINECKERKPCDQLCFNTEGSFYCKCKAGFTLDSDQQSCRKISFNPKEDAFETRDLETNDLDYDDISSRLDMLEKMISSEKTVLTNDVNQKLSSAMETINNLQTRIDTIEHQQQNLKNIQTKLATYDNQAKRIDNIVDLLFKCRTKSNIYCP